VFYAGLLTGGMLTAAVLLVAGSLLRVPLPTPARWAVVGLVLIVVLLRQSGLLPIRLPESRRLVPETVFRLGRHLGPLQFGLEMGTGVRTYLPSGLPYVGAVAVLLTASTPLALCAGAGFGLGRALMTLSSKRYGADDGWDREWRDHARTLAVLTGTAFMVSLLSIMLWSGTP
jgi:Na+-driven multidrug efflux pump